ncbi:exosome complex exonuclease Rrp41 [Candidatus Woesearchaeota archaeon]|nr:MAG: exosome complex exonuclease Rrp41 [Candidatus Woesearchaeota archaeon]
MKKSEFKRPDGRAYDEIRQIKAEVGIVSRADGSARFQIGKTVAYAAVYGPRSLYPKFLQNPKRGLLRCYYNMLPFSSKGERVKPGPSRRALEISLVTEKALTPAIDLTKYPNAVVDVFIELPQTDAGTRCAGITAAAMALADAGIVMYDLVSAVAVGYVNGNLIADLIYDEEAYPGEVADIPVAYMPRYDKFSLLQMDGKISGEQLQKALELAKKVCLQIYNVQKKALKRRYEKYKSIGNVEG